MVFQEQGISAELPFMQSFSKTLQEQANSFWVPLIMQRLIILIFSLL